MGIGGVVGGMESKGGSQGVTVGVLDVGCSSKGGLDQKSVQGASDNNQR